MNDLVTNNLALAYWVANKFAARYGSRVDWKEEAALALVEAAGRYNPDIAKFSTYATAFIRGRLLNALRDESRQLPCVEGDLARTVVDPKLPASTLDVDDELRPIRAAIATLRPAQRRSLEGRLAGKSMRAIAREYGVSASAIAQSARNGVIRLREILKDKEVGA